MSSSPTPANDENDNFRFNNIFPLLDLNESQWGVEMNDDLNDDEWITQIEEEEEKQSEGSWKSSVIHITNPRAMELLPRNIYHLYPLCEYNIFFVSPTSPKLFFPSNEDGLRYYGGITPTYPSVFGDDRDVISPCLFENNPSFH